MSELELAKTTEYNAKAEAQAVFDYTEMIRQVEESEIEEEKKQNIVGVIAEIVADELNHEQKLLELYTYLTGIEPNKD